MEKERAIIAYKHYFADFMNSIGRAEAGKIAYVLDMLKTQQRVSEKFVKAIRDGLYEIRTEYSGNIYRVFFIFDNGNIVVLFNGFQKKTQKMPSSEIDKALKLKEEYYETKRNK
jgi:putative addiction module killer protein